MNVLLVDKPPSLRSALDSAVHQLGLGVSVTAVASSDAARRVLRAEDPFDLILLNVNVDAAGYDLLCEAGNARHATLVLVLCAFNCEVEVVRSLSLGAAGFLSNVAPVRVLIEILCAAATNATAVKRRGAPGRNYQPR